MISFTQRNRLLREDPWPDATALAQEIFAMLSPDTEVEHNGPLNLRANPNGSPMIVRNYADGDSLITVNRPGGGPGGKVVIRDNQIVFEPSQGTSGTTVVAGTNTFLGKITSGTGANYIVALYPNGPNGGVGGSVSAFHPEAASDAQFPIGTWITVVQAGGTYIFTSAVWL
jgi:hypothetical protein